MKKIPSIGTKEYMEWYYKQRKKQSWHPHIADKQMGFVKIQFVFYLLGLAKDLIFFGSIVYLINRVNVNV